MGVKICALSMLCLSMVIYVNSYLIMEKIAFSREVNSTLVCNSTAFGGNVNAVRACLAAYALQHNWYPSPIAGLFSYQTWNGFDGFWQDGTVLETLANFMYYGNNTMYKSVVTGSVRDVYSLLEAYYPEPSFDDMAWYGLSYVRIHEVLGKEDNSTYMSFLYEARQIYDWIWAHGWDNTSNCGGGFWFDYTQVSKQNVENSQMLMLGAKLYRLTKDKTLLERIEKTWQFIEMNGLICNSTYLVADGARANCTSNEVFGPTYNMGLMIGGLVEAGQALNQTSKFLSLAHKVALATIRNSTKNGILVEYCTPSCSNDALMFKGIFLRNLRYLIDYMIDHPDQHGIENVKVYQQFIQHNSDIVWKNNRCEPASQNCTIVYKDGRSLYDNTVGPIFGVEFSGPFNYSAPMQQTAVLDLFNAAISPGTKCKGELCNYDPPIPQPHPLTCKDNPCPSDQPCCEYEQEYYTCCESTQKCQNGECI